MRLPGRPEWFRKTKRQRKDAALWLSRGGSWQKCLPARWIVFGWRSWLSKPYARIFSHLFCFSQELWLPLQLKQPLCSCVFNEAFLSLDHLQALWLLNQIIAEGLLPSTLVTLNAENWIPSSFRTASNSGSLTSWGKLTREIKNYLSPFSSSTRFWDLKSTFLACCDACIFYLNRLLFCVV